MRRSLHGVALAFLLWCAACDTDSSRARRVGAGGVPLVEMPAARPGGRVLALVLSGDGDWAALVDRFSRHLADSGIAVVGVRARTYLSAEDRAPDGVASDMARVLRMYLERWNRDQILIAGYSRGADLAPFIVSRLPADLRARIRLVALLSPAPTTNFRFHAIDLVRTIHRASDVPLLPEVERMRGVPALCVYGRTETESLCPEAPAGLMHVVAREGGHRTTDDALLARLVLTDLLHQVSPPTGSLR